MKLPHHEQATISEQKIVGYLLSFSHPDGKSKAQFFSQFGFSASHWEELAEAFRRHAAEHDIAEEKATPFGTSYTIEGPLAAPDGRSPVVRAVWFIETGAVIPRLVTAYPRRGASRSQP
ncbi:MAG TPA: hypothetical protein VFY89_10220 [Ktedonobacterales bacterium]